MLLKFPISFVFLIVLFFLYFPTDDGRLIECRDADVGGTLFSNRNRKFLIIGNENNGGGGIGNLLIFYPAAYYFSVFTSREIIIEDKSVLGEMCNIITCGFPFVSDLKRAFPTILTDEAIITAPYLKAWDFQHYMETDESLLAPVIRAAGYLPKSDWWVYFNQTVHCVHKVTGCDVGDVPCADRHAYQHLVRGPFRSYLTQQEEERISGIPDHIKHAILTLPHAYAPRLDIAIHLRCQFQHFEENSDVNNPAYKKEVHDWLNTSESVEVFDYFRSRLKDTMTEIKNNQLKIARTPEEKNQSLSDPIYIYLASDNQDVKNYIGSFLLNQTFEYPIQIMKVESTKGIHHVKNIQKLKEATNNEGLMDLIFDWYSLSLSNTILAWRKGGTGLVSTFVQSAQHVSGTTQRTNIELPLGEGGIGSRGYQLVQNKRGMLHWDGMWIYGFAEDYQINGH